MTITWVKTTEGWTAFDGNYKVCNMGTSSNNGLSRNGVMLREPIPRESWCLHFTSPAVSLVLLAAVLASIPVEA